MNVSLAWRQNAWLHHLLFTVIGLLMIYPLVWWVGASFKSNVELLSPSIRLAPPRPSSPLSHFHPSLSRIHLAT